MRKTAFIFTGQGFEKCGMLHQLPNTEAAGKKLRQASQVLGESWEQMDTARALQSNRYTQLCIYIFQCVWSDFLKQYCSFEFVSGHSVGSFAAAVTGGVLKYEDGLRLVEARGAMMEQMFFSGYGMMAVSGISAGLMEDILEAFRAEIPEVCVYLATINEDRQCVLSGSRQDLERIAFFIHKKYPAKVVWLNVKVPSHCLLMNPVAEKLKILCGGISWARPNKIYIMNSTARSAGNADQIRRDLEEGVCRPVRWYDGITLMKELGVETFVEVGPTHILTEIGKRSYGDLKWMSGDPGYFL